MERRRFSQTMASEWQTAFVVSYKMPWCALLTAVKNFNKSLDKLQDFFFKTKTKCSKPRLHDPRQRLSFLSSRRLETKTLEDYITGNFTPIGARGGNAAPKWQKFLLFGKESPRRGASYDPFLKLLS